ncbi:MAG: hypothetical protein JNJ83_04865 [Verrucomicrobiaceae bacterium]|nr:hypothetical protein [Verrucomicrobiaceae bacterium]
MRILLPLIAFSASTLSGAVDYQKQIQPLWDEHCTDCHGSGDADGGLSLENFAALQKGGDAGQSFEPGKADESLLVKFLEGKSGKIGKNQFMPPGKRAHLSPQQTALVKQWITEGAKGPSDSTPKALLLPKVTAKSNTKPIYSIATSPDSAVAAIGRYGSVELVDLKLRQSKGMITGIAGKASSLVFSQDGAQLYVAAGEAGITGTAYQLHVADKTIVREFTGHRDALHAVALSADGTRLATGGYDQLIKLWDTASGKEVTTLKGHNGSVNGLSFRPDSKVLASASADRTIKLWDTTKGSRLDTFSQPTKEQFAVAFTPDGKKVIAGGADNRIRIWEVSPTATEGSNPIQATQFAHEGAVLALSFSKDGKLLASSASDKTIKLWDASTFSEKSIFEKQPDWAGAIAWIASDRLATARQDGSSALHTLGKAIAEQLISSPPKPMAKPKAKAAAEVTNISPRGFQICRSTRLTLAGKNLQSLKAIKTSDARITAKIVSGGPTMVIQIDTPAELPRGVYSIAGLPLLGDNIPQSNAPPEAPIQSGTNFFGVLRDVGQRDNYPFDAKAGETIVLDVAARSIGSKAETIQLEVFDASGSRLAFSRGLDSGTDPFIAFKAPKSGIYTARVSETTLDGSPSHHYRLTVGLLPYITGWWPLAVPAGKTTTVNLIGVNLPSSTMQVTDGNVPSEIKTLRSRYPLTIPISTMTEAIEAEPNDDLATAPSFTVPGVMNGRLYNTTATSDADHFKFSAKKNEQWIIETAAAVHNAPTDTKIEVLTATGQPVERVRLRAMRDTWNNFRSVDANNPDIRLEFWTEMDLNDYVYFNGDVMRIFRNPRGPDAGFLFYNNGGKRIAWFDTTATGHALEEPAYIVQPLTPGEQPVPNGLPVFSIPCANDDDGQRKLGRDSKLTFTAPVDGHYVIRVTDSRGWSGDRFAYRLIARKPVPSFKMQLLGMNDTIGRGGNKGVSLRAERLDGFEGAITVTVSDVPQGWHVSSPVVIQAGHVLATGSLSVSESAPETTDFSKMRVIATAIVEGRKIEQAITGFGTPKIGPKPRFIANLEPSVQDQPVKRASSTPLEITLSPGQSVAAFIRVDRFMDKGLLNFDIHNLPFGVIVDNIGLNGVQVREGEDIREIFLTAAKWVPEQDRLIHAAVASTRNEQTSEGLETSYPVLLKIRKPSAVVQK